MTPKATQNPSKIGLWSHFTFNQPMCSITYYLQCEIALRPHCTGLKIIRKSIPIATWIYPASQDPQNHTLNSKMFQLGPNMAPTWAQHVSIWEGSGGCKTCQSRPWSPTCQPRPHIAPPRCLQGRILVDVGLMLERFSAGFWLISSSIFWCWDRWLLDQITKRLIYQTGFNSTKLALWKSRGRRQRR